LGRRFDSHHPLLSLNAVRADAAKNGLSIFFTQASDGRVHAVGHLRYWFRPKWKVCHRLPDELLEVSLRVGVLYPAVVLRFKLQVCARADFCSAHTTARRTTLRRMLRTCHLPSPVSSNPEDSAAVTPSTDSYYAPAVVLRGTSATGYDRSARGQSLLHRRKRAARPAECTHR
jgi:hypothetical protein